MDDLYLIITWPEIQEWMVEPGFREHSYLMNDEKGMEEMGSSTYFVSTTWMKQIQDKYSYISNYYVELINKKNVFVKNEDIDSFLKYCERFDLTPNGGAITEDGKWFYIE